MLPPVYVLVGGQSRRFGADKATHTLDGEPWALHVARRLSQPEAEITLVGTLEDAGPLASLRRIDDSPAADGPLAGVLAALEDRGEGFLTLASCDLVRPESAWLTPLLAAHRADGSLDVAVYRAADRWQPFPCVVNARWHRRLLELAESGTRSLQRAFDTSTVAAIEWPGHIEGPSQANAADELRARLGDSAT